MGLIKFIGQGIFFFTRTRARAFEKYAFCIAASIVFVSADICAGETVSSDTLISDLKSSDLKTRYDALQSIPSKPSSTQIDALIQVAIGDTDVRFRLATLDKIALSGHPEFVTRISVLLSDSNAFVRRRAAQAIGLLGGVDATEVLSHALRNESDPRVKSAIQAALDLEAKTTP